MRARFVVVVALLTALAAPPASAGQLEEEAKRSANTFLLKAKRGIAKGSEGTFELTLRKTRVRTRLASLIDLSSATIGTNRFVRRWRRSSPGFVSGALSWRGSSSGSGAVAVRVKALKLRSSSLKLKVQVLPALDPILAALLVQETIDGSVPRRAHGMTLALDGGRIRAGGCVIPSDRSSSCTTSNWTQERWDRLMGKERAAPVEAKLTTGGSASGTFTYYDIGDRSDPTILMLSGVGTTKTEWDPAFLEELSSKGYRLIIVDYPGVATASIDSYDNFTVSNLADFSIAFVRRLGLEDPNVLGWAFSGKIAALMFERNGSELGSYVNVAGDIYNPEKEKIPDQVLRDLTSTDPALSVRQAWPGTLEGLANALSVSGRGIAVTQEKRKTVFENAYYDAEKSWQDGDSSVTLEAIEAPSLVIAGGLDDISPASRMRTAAGLLGSNRAAYRQFNGGGHTVLYQYRHRVIRLVDNKLSEWAQARAR